MGIPDISGVADLIFKSASFLAAFPFVNSQAPAILTYENVIKIIAIYSNRLSGILTPDYNLAKLLFMSFAVFENVTPDSKRKHKTTSENDVANDGNNNDDEDDLVVFSLKKTDTWDDLDVIKSVSTQKHINGYVSAYSLYKIISFLLAIFELRAPQSPINTPKFVNYFSPHEYHKFQKAALNIIRSIDPKIPFKPADTNTKLLQQWVDDLESMKIAFEDFEPAFLENFPHLFKPLGELFSKMMFSSLPNEKGKQKVIEEKEHEDASSQNEIVQPSTDPNDFFAKEGATKLINPASMAQLSAMLGPNLYYKLKKLYVGSEAGFSLRSFENKVFKWHAPTYMLVSGREVTVPGSNARERQFNETIHPLPQSRNHNGATDKGRRMFVFGAYISEPWKAHTKNNFGNDETFLFQLKPVQDKFEAVHNISSSQPYASAAKPHHYVYYTRSQPGGIGLGSPPPHSEHRKSTLVHYELGNVSLTLDESLEYGVFRHVGVGGSFKPTNGHRRYEEWEDRFEITEIEVWGSGEDEDLEEQKKRWEWEEREANYRQQVNLKNLGEEKAFLEMAGLVGGHAGGGSM